MQTGIRSVVVVGASRGIGRATVRYLDAHGLRVFAGARQEMDPAACASLGRQVEAVRVDVTDDGSIDAARAEVESRLAGGGLDALVYCAAKPPGGGSGRPMEYATRESLAQIFQVNCFGMAATIQAFMPLLRRAHGRIVVVGGGGASTMAMPLAGAVCASKFALEAMCDALRLEMRRAGVRVSVVEPGMTYAGADREAFRRAMHADLDAVLQVVPEAGRSYYQPVVDRLRTFYASWLDRAAAPERVARRIHHALTARRPRTRYWCGAESKAALIISRITTSRMRDALWGRTAGL